MALMKIEYKIDESALIPMKVCMTESW